MSAGLLCKWTLISMYVCMYVRAFDLISYKPRITLSLRYGANNASNELFQLFVTTAKLYFEQKQDKKVISDIVTI